MQFPTKRISLHDPHGYMCSYENKFCRVVLKNYQLNYDNLVSANLFKVLIDKGLLISHSEVSLQDLGLENDSSVYKVLLPQQLDFISYPQEDEKCKYYYKIKQISIKIIHKKILKKSLNNIIL